MAVRQRLEELRAPAMPEDRPLATEVFGLETRGVDDRLALVRVDRADGIDDDAVAPHPLRGDTKEPRLELRERMGAPAQIGPLGEDAEPRAQRVDEHLVEPGEVV